MTDLLVLTGPIASGKSSVAEALGDRVRRAGRSVAILDFDDVVDTIGGFADLSSELFKQAFVVYGRLIGAWLGVSTDVVAHVPAFDQSEMDAVLHAVPTGTRVRKVLLLCTYEAALGRVAADPGRRVSRDASVLRRAYDRFEASLPLAARVDWTFDTTRWSVDEIVERLSAETIR